MRVRTIISGLGIAVILVSTACLYSCKEEVPERPDPVEVVPRDSLDPQINDDYSAIAEQTHSNKWGPYNLHDPTIIKHGDWYHIFSTDVAYGPNGQCGIMHRRSMDLVQWQFLGWVFNGVPDIPLQFMETYQPAYRQESIWAPCIYEHEGSYRLYYSVPGNDWLKLACIGLASSESPDGPWKDEGIVISCQPDDHFNAIDPAVLVDPQEGKHWFAYGSYSSGIYLVELDPATGKRKDETDFGHKIAFRNANHDAIEGAEIVYNKDQGMYYLFVSYDWLEDTYNVRVGRSEKAEGPYLDIHGKNLAQPGDNLPMITAQYQFENHSGWQGVGHCGILCDGENYYFVSQGRLGANKYLMDLHVRRMLWTSEGWPVVSPERFADIPDPQISEDDLVGAWEHILLAKITSKNQSTNLVLDEGGILELSGGGTWDYSGDELTLVFQDQPAFRCRVFHEWDWEQKVPTLVYTGMNSEGRCVWGKKKNVSVSK